MVTLAWMWLLLDVTMQCCGCQRLTPHGDVVTFNSVDKKLFACRDKPPVASPFTAFHYAKGRFSRLKRPNRWRTWIKRGKCYPHFIFHLSVLYVMRWQRDGWRLKDVAVIFHRLSGCGRLSWQMLKVCGCICQQLCCCCTEGCAKSWKMTGLLWKDKTCRFVSESSGIASFTTQCADSHSVIRNGEGLKDWQAVFYE